MNTFFACCVLGQYLGSRSPEPVKKKVLELIYSWTLALPDEAKITDAYQMLKKQGERRSIRSDLEALEVSAPNVLRSLMYLKRLHQIFNTMQIISIPVPLFFS